MNGLKSLLGCIMLGLMLMFAMAPANAQHLPPGGSNLYATCSANSDGSVVTWSSSFTGNTAGDSIYGYMWATLKYTLSGVVERTVNVTLATTSVYTSTSHDTGNIITDVDTASVISANADGVSCDDCDVQYFAATKDTTTGALSPEPFTDQFHIAFDD